MNIGKKYTHTYYQLEIDSKSATSALGKSWLRLAQGKTPEEALAKFRNNVRNFNPPFNSKDRTFRMIKCTLEQEAVWYLDNSDSVRKDVTTIAVV
jgi:hypothetical protein